MKRALYISLNVVLAAALGIVIWLIVDKLQGPPPPKVVYEVIAQDDISHQVPELQVKLVRLVFRVERGEGLNAVRDYLKQHRDQDQADAYDVITNKGFFLVVGRQFDGKIDNLPEAVKRVLGSWREAERVGREGPYLIYHYRPG